jgi:hypothetical protein
MEIKVNTKFSLGDYVRVVKSSNEVYRVEEVRFCLQSGADPAIEYTLQNLNPVGIQQIYINAPESQLARYHGRDPARIKGMLSELEKVWIKNPDWRLGQLICNANSKVDMNPSFKDVFNLEDEYMLYALKELQ